MVKYLRSALRLALKSRSEDKEEDKEDGEAGVAPSTPALSLRSAEVFAEV